MSTLSLRLPASLHRDLKGLADREGVSINQIISSAVGEKIAALRTLDYLRERADRGGRAAFDAVLARVPDVDPPEFDRLPERTAASARRVGPTRKVARRRRATRG